MPALRTGIIRHEHDDSPRLDAGRRAVGRDRVRANFIASSCELG